MKNPGNGNLWRDSLDDAVVAPPLDGKASADLVIIGAGYTGCSAALHAAQAGHEVILLEAESIGHGGSGRNVGLVNAGLWILPETIEASLGEQQAGKLNSLLAQAPDLVFSLIEKHGIHCEATRSGTLHCAHSASGLGELKERHRQFRKLGAPVELIDAGDTAARTGSGVFHGSLYDPRAGTIQPLAYCRGIARAAQSAGAQLHEKSAALSVVRRGSHWSVKTPGGEISAAALLLATNAYHGDALGVDAPASIPVHYFQLATAPLDKRLGKSILPGGEGCWDTAMVMSSFRRDGAGRLIIGGIGSLDHAGGEIHRRWASRKLAALFPRLAGQPLQHAWCGRISMTSDHIPKIQSLGENAFSIFGYSGRGIGPGTTFGKAVGLALVCGDQRALPLRPVEQYAESITPLKCAFYECGASIFHLINR